MYLHRPPANFNNETHRVIQIHERFDDVGTASALGHEIECGTRPGLPREFNPNSLQIAEPLDNWRVLGKINTGIIKRLTIQQGSTE